MSPSKSLVIWIAVFACAAACHHPRPIAPSQAPLAPVAPPALASRPAPSPPPPPPMRVAQPTTPVESPLSEDEAFRRKTLDQLNAEQPLADVFFYFEQASLTAADREDLDRDAHWLQRWKQTAIEIDGYCDERGTDEYNLALGDRRARAARDYLVDLGVDRGRIRIVSFGKERGFCHESNETCWAQNRRGHFVVTAK